MNVLAITILVSLCLAGIFLMCFFLETTRKNKRSLEQDSLLPFQDDSNS